jgi:hypothetical protein
MFSIMHTTLFDPITTASGLFFKSLLKRWITGFEFKVWMFGGMLSKKDGYGNRQNVKKMTFYDE